MITNMTAVRKAAVLLLVLCCLAGSAVIPLTVSAEEDWRKEFDEICAKTQDAMSLQPGELRGLAERCDRLRLRIEKLDESQRKVFLKRLQMCKDLFVFVLQTKEQEK